LRRLNSFDASDGKLASAEVDFLAVQTKAAAVGDHDGLVVKRIVRFGEALVGAAGRGVELGGTFHAERFVRPLVGTSPLVVSIILERDHQHPRPATPDYRTVQSGVTLRVRKDLSRGAATYEQQP